MALIAIELATIIYIMCTRTDPPRPMQPFDCSTVSNFYIVIHIFESFTQFLSIQPSADSVELLAHVQITAIIGAICACIGLVIPHLEEAAYEKFMLVIVFAVVVISKYARNFTSFFFHPDTFLLIGFEFLFQVVVFTPPPFFIASPNSSKMVNVSLCMALFSDI